MSPPNDPQAAQAEAQRKELEKLQIEAENLAKRMRGEEVESDKEVEGDLDAVPMKFEAEHGLPPEHIQKLVQQLLAVLDDDEAHRPAAKNAAAIESDDTADLDIETYLRKRGFGKR